MTDYTVRASRSPIKAAAMWVVTRKIINKPIVYALSGLPDSDWRARVPVITNAAELKIDNHEPVVFSGVERCQIARELFWGGGRLRSAADRNALDIAIKLSRDSQLFLDVGAYTGLFALAVARSNPQTRCFAYEIVPENFLLLVSNVIRNNLVSQVRPLLHGVGAETGSIRVPATFGPGVLASSVALDSKSDIGVEIPVSPLDSLHSNESKKVVIKIDVEGFEHEVLQGAENLIRNVQPDIICEVLRRAPKIPEIEHLLKSAGYRMFHIRDDGVVMQDHITPTRNERDWLFTQRSDADLAALGVSRIERPSGA